MAVKVVYCSLFFVILSELRSMIIGTKQIQPQTMLKYTKQMIAGGMKTIPIAALATLSPNVLRGKAVADDKEEIGKKLIYDGKLDGEAYTTIGNLKTCRIVNGMWQVSGAHGYNPSKYESVADMSRYVSNGYTTFDLADIYGPAEDYVGAFVKGSLSSSSNAKECQFFTKWVPRPQDITRKIVVEAIDRSLGRMNVDSLDLLQFHWWDYNNKNYFDAVSYLMELQDETQAKIKNLGLTNFDTKHMVDLIDEGAPIVSNQVSFSIVDTRPREIMFDACKEHNVKLLCYGVLLGGFLSSSWLNKPEPDPSSLTNVSLRKYYPWIMRWGGWQLFQELLSTLNKIAEKYQVSISNVATRWVLEQPFVGGAIIGARLGYREHVKDNQRVFDFKLDDSDRAAIEDIQSRSAKGGLMKAFGDCGGEYRRRA